MGGEFKHFWDVLINGQRPGWKEISCALCAADPEQAHLAAPSEAARKAFCAPNRHAGGTVQQHPLAERLSRYLESRLSTLF